IMQTLNLPPCAMVSWRFPYLHFDDDGFTAIDNAGYRTDASVEFGYDYWNKLPPPYDMQFPNGLSNLNPEYGKHFWWPFTLGNRTPLNAGMHSDIYSMFNSDADSSFKNSGSDRRIALQCFVDYALTKPDVRFVTFKEVVEWMRNPKAIH